MSPEFAKEFWNCAQVLGWLFGGGVAIQILFYLMTYSRPKQIEENQESELKIDLWKQ